MNRGTIECAGEVGWYPVLIRTYGLERIQDPDSISCDRTFRGPPWIPRGSSISLRETRDTSDVSCIVGGHHLKRLPSRQDNRSAAKKTSYKNMVAGYVALDFAFFFVIGQVNFHRR